MKEMLKFTYTSLLNKILRKETKKKTKKQKTMVNRSMGKEVCFQIDGVNMCPLEED